VIEKVGSEEHEQRKCDSEQYGGIEVFDVEIRVEWNFVYVTVYSKWVI